nr:hypothetical protein [Candidatus Sigynarchaeum springense]
MARVGMGIGSQGSTSSIVNDNEREIAGERSSTVARKVKIYQTRA